MLIYSLTEEIKEPRKYSHHYSFDELSILLNKKKSELDKPYNETKNTSFDFSRVSTFFEMSKMLKKDINIPKVSNAYLKLYEMLNHFKIVEKNNNNIFTYFDNASFPGAFIRSLDHYVKQNVPNVKYLDWFASSLYNNEKDVLGDDYNLLYNYRFRWLMNKENNGDVSNPDNVLEFRYFFQNVGLVSLYTSDLGFDVSSDYSKQEIFHLKPNIGQILCGLESTKDGGCQITKQFTFFEIRNRIVLFLLTKMYKHVYIVKPITSKPDNSEIYIVCLNYNRQDSLQYRELLLNALKHWDQQILETISIPQEFNNSLLYISNEIYLRQIDKISFNINLFYTLIKTHDKSKLVKLPKEFYNQLKKEVNEWLIKNPIRHINNPLPITKTLMSNRESKENNIIINKSIFKNENKTLLSSRPGGGSGKTLVDYYNDLFKNNTIFQVDSLYGKTLIYNENDKDITILLFNLLMKCGVLLREVMLLYYNRNSLVDKIKLIKNREKFAASREGSNFYKFIHKVHLNINNKEFDNIVLSSKNDIEFLTLLSKHYTQQKQEKNEGRELSRIKDIEKFLIPFKNKNNPLEGSGQNIKYLDLGSSEGKITSTIALYLNLPKTDAIGIDVKEESKESDNFTYIQYNGTDIPFPNDTFDLATIFMALHHFTNLDKTLTSLNRVMKLNSILIVREHDVKDEKENNMSVFLDFIHAFYMTISNNEETIEQFANEYQKGDFAFYKSLDEWSYILYKYGFKMEIKIEKHDIFNSGYLILIKFKNV